MLATSISFVNYQKSAQNNFETVFVDIYNN